MSDHLSVFEAQIAGSKIKCSDFMTQKLFLFEYNKKTVKMVLVSPRPWEKASLWLAAG